MVSDETDNINYEMYLQNLNQRMEKCPGVLHTPHLQNCTGPSTKG